MVSMFSAMLFLLPVAEGKAIKGASNSDIFRTNKTGIQKDKQCLRTHKPSPMVSAKRTYKNSSGCVFLTIFEEDQTTVGPGLTIRLIPNVSFWSYGHKQTHPITISSPLS